MPTRHRALEHAAIAAADTWYSLTEIGGVAQPMVVPEGVSRLRKITSAIGMDFSALGSGVFILRLSGQGFKEQNTFVIGAGGGELITGGGALTTPLVQETNIEVIPGGQMVVEIMTNADTGDPSVGVELCFE